MSTAHTLLAQALAAYDAADANWKPAEWFESVRVYLAKPVDQRPAPDYPLMRAAFQTSESGNGRYKAVFQFPTLQCMQAAVMQWHGVQKPLPSPAWCASVDAELADTAEADAQRMPLTDEQIEDLRADANRGYCIEREDYFKAFRDAERAHGIKCLTCNGHGLVGGLQGGEGAGYVCEDCPDCNAPDPTLPAAAVAEGLERDGDALEQAS